MNNNILPVCSSMLLPVDCAFFDGGRKKPVDVALKSLPKISMKNGF